jgi:O-antigen/teichoic acid export membrane protein
LVLPDIMKIKFSFDTALLKKALNYSWPLTVIALAASFNSYFTTPLVKFLSGGGAVGEAEAGVFSAGLKLSLLVNLFSTAYNYAAEPFFFKQSNQSKDKSIFGKAALAFTIFTCFVVMAIYSFIDVLQFLLGSEVRGGIIVMPLLLMANVFIGLYYNVSMWYKLSDNTRTGLLISLMGMAITYGVCYLLIPKIGILGAAWATFLCYLTMLVTSYFQGQKYYPLVYPVKKILTYLFATSFLLVLFWVMREKMNLDKIYIITINIIVFCIFTIIVYTLEIKRFVPEIKNKVLSKLKT